MYVVAGILFVLSGLFYAAGHHEIGFFAWPSRCAVTAACFATARITF